MNQYLSVIHSTLSAKCGTTVSPFGPKVPFSHSPSLQGVMQQSKARAEPALRAKAVLLLGQVLTAVQTRAMSRAKDMPDAAIQSKGYGLGNIS